MTPGCHWRRGRLSWGGRENEICPKNVSVVETLRRSERFEMRPVQQRGAEDLQEPKSFLWDHRVLDDPGLVFKLCFIYSFLMEYLFLERIKKI